MNRRIDPIYKVSFVKEALSSFYLINTYREHQSACSALVNFVLKASSFFEKKYHEQPKEIQKKNKKNKRHNQIFYPKYFIFLNQSSYTAPTLYQKKPPKWLSSPRAIFFFFFFFYCKSIFFLSN
jgi:hypothetical protein